MSELCGGLPQPADHGERDLAGAVLCGDDGRHEWKKVMRSARWAERREAIVQRWVHLTLATYPADAVRFLREEPDPFANPVGSTIAEALAALFGELLAGLQPERVRPLLDRVIRLRAVQDFSPSQAVGFIFLLKPVLREELAKAGREAPMAEELAELEAEIDRLGLLAFDLFMGCREQIFALRVKELRAGQEVAQRRLARARSR